MESLVYITFQILSHVFILLVLSYIMSMFTGDPHAINISSFLNNTITSVLEIPTKIVNFILCVAFQIIDFIIEVLWDMIPGLSDVFDAPSASDLFDAC